MGILLFALAVLPLFYIDIQTEAEAARSRTLQQARAARSSLCRGNEDEELWGDGLAA